MQKMNPEIKAKWVAALRSGEYKQGTGQLRDTNDNFCCLGVLCNLHAQAHPEIAAQQTDPEEYLDGKELLPFEVEKWAKLTRCSGSYVVIDEVNLPLSVHNDDGCTFAQIADAIEAQL